MCAAFGQKSFWDNRYRGFGLKSAFYEWYLPWSALRPYLVQHVPLFSALEASTKQMEVTASIPTPSSSSAIHILEVGCGNSSLALDLWREWGGIDTTHHVPRIQSIVAIDFCDRVIEVMRTRCNSPPLVDNERGVIYLVATAQDLHHFYLPVSTSTSTSVSSSSANSTTVESDKRESEQERCGVEGGKTETKRVEVMMPEQTARYSVVIDKGTLDSMVCTPNADTLIRQYLHEVSRVLRPGGYFVLVSCALCEERLPLVANTKLYGWHIRQNILHIKQHQQLLKSSMTHLDSDTTPSPSEEELYTNIYIILIQKESDPSSHEG
jgi:ubiquinone/menaquinone biosynthesis C-methylase UbiE